LFLVVHSGSRHLGTEVAEYYQNEGRRALWGGANYQVQEVIAQLKAEGRFKEIQKTISALKKEHELSIPKDLAYVEGKLFEDYINDMKITQKFAMHNRKAMVDVIMTGMGLTAVEQFTTIHNYIDTESMILRKGSVSAELGEKLLIPINMRDGKAVLRSCSLLCFLIPIAISVPTATANRPMPTKLIRSIHDALKPPERIAASATSNATKVPDAMVIIRSTVRLEKGTTTSQLTSLKF